MATKGKISDKKLLDWLENNYGAGLISDDAGRWAISEAGMQNVPDFDTAIDITTTFFVEANDWRDSIREAIKVGMRREKDGS